MRLLQGEKYVDVLPLDALSVAQVNVTTPEIKQKPYRRALFIAD